MIFFQCFIPYKIDKLYKNDNQIHHRKIDRKDQQRNKSTQNTTYKTEDRATRTQTKTDGGLGILEGINRLNSLCGTRHGSPVTPSR